MATTVSAQACSICGEPLGGNGHCVVCLLRVGLDQEQTKEEARPDAFAFEGFEIKRREDGSLWELGRGAMGVTYRALDKSLHRNVALKVIDPLGQASGSSTVQDRFLREARAAAALRHPNVAGVFQFGTLSDRCYYAMELVEGETLEARVRRDGPLPVHLALEIAIQVTQALSAAAAHGLVHRDLKPGNIMLAHDPAAPAAIQAKVIDFGLAKATADTLGEMDLTHGGFVGTPTFASPEQFEGSEVDPRSDIYSLGATLWYALTGLTPYSGRTIEAIRDCQKHAALPVEQLVARKVPASLIALLRRTLAAEPAQRPASARELMELLQSLRRKLARRRTVTLISLGLFLICAAGLTSYLWQRRHATSAMLPEKSVAVLPFENLSKDEANAFFAGGMQDEILSDLAKIADLKVISRTSVMEYKNASKRNLREIGKVLGVSHFVEGSVQRAGDRIRVTVQLIDARTDNHLWADHYDRNVTDVFAIQSEIARQIAEQLRSKLSPAERTALAERPTADLKAYELFTTATAINVWDDWRGAEKSMVRKMKLLEQATQRDPGFVLAWCALAKTHCDLVDNLYPAHLELARKAADTALRLRPDLGEVHRELARYYYYANDFAQAYEELTVALRTLPNDSETFRIAAETNRHRNRWDEAVANFQKAYELDPRNDEVIYHLGGVYEEMRRYDEWEQLLTKADANQPGPDPWWEMALAQIKLDKGDPVASQALLAKVPLDFSPTNEIWNTRFTTALYLRDYDAASRVIVATPAKFTIGDLYGSPPESWATGLVARFRGDKAKAEAIFTAARKKFDAAWRDKSKDHRYFVRVAALDAGLGRKQEAIEQARRAVDLMPIAKDSARGPWLVRNLAMVYAWTGERDLAIEQLELVAKIPGGPSYGELRFDPTWDSLRGDSRFERIVAGLAPKTVSTAEQVAREKSIAVLPFENLSEDKQNVFFADGLQDDVLTSLAKIGELKVISRTSASQYRGTDGARNLRVIARELGVQNILEGSVRREGNRVLVNVQLIDATEDRHVWAEHYDRAITDSIGLQGELAAEIAAALRANVAPDEKARLAAKPTNDANAYLLYLKALEREGTANRSTADATAAEQLYTQAIAIDPKFALAYARASLLNSVIFYSSGKNQPGKLKARNQAEEALRLSPNLGEAHLALGLHLYSADKDYAASLREFSTAAAASPNNAEILQYMAWIYRRQGRWRESLANYQRAQDLDPRNRRIVSYAAFNCLLVRDWPAATATFNRALEIAPDSALDTIGLAYLEVFRNSSPSAAREILRKIPAGVDPDGKVTEANWDLAMLERDFNAAEKIVTAFPSQEFPRVGELPKTFYQGRIARARGDLQSAHRLFEASKPIVEAWKRDDPEDPQSHAFLGLLYAYLGRKEDAIREARQAVDLEPESKNAYHGAARTANLAQVYALLGESDQAINLIERLLSTPGPVQFPLFPENMTLADLRLRWEWDSLRGDPRFQKLIMGPEPKTNY